MKNYSITFEGPRNSWGKGSNRVTCFSTSLDFEFSEWRVMYLSMHLWLLGFQIFELVIVKN